MQMFFELCWLSDFKPAAQLCLYFHCRRWVFLRELLNRPSGSHIKPLTTCQWPSVSHYPSVAYKYSLAVMSQLFCICRNFPLDLSNTWIIAPTMVISSIRRFSWVTSGELLAATLYQGLLHLPLKMSSSLPGKKWVCHPQIPIFLPVSLDISWYHMCLFRTFEKQTLRHSKVERDFWRELPVKEMPAFTLKSQFKDINKLPANDWELQEHYSHPFLKDVDLLW